MRDCGRGRTWAGGAIAVILLAVAGAPARAAEPPEPANPSFPANTPKGGLKDGCCDPSYVPGDRVQLLRDNPDGAVALPAGACGTVVCCDASDSLLPVMVSWDGWANGNSNDRLCGGEPFPYAPGSGWWVACEDVAPSPDCACDEHGEHRPGNLAPKAHNRTLLPWTQLLRLKAK